MKKFLDVSVEAQRVRIGAMSSTADDGMNGVFLLQGPLDRQLQVIASDGGGWEHVSVSVADDPLAIPSWEEMAWVAAQFWQDEECVVQFRPPKSRYVNHHPGVLHWWKPVGKKLPMPPLVMV